MLDNLSLGTVSNLDWKGPGDKLEFVEGDAGDATLLPKLVAGCELVFHEAALPSVPRSVEDPLASHQHNMNATLNMLLSARDAGVKRFLFASSSSVYGNNDAEYKHEQLPVAPLSPYALQKYAGERYVQLFYQLYGMETVALRYFNVFGPRQAADSPYSGVIAKFCMSMLKGETPTIFGDGEQSRDFTFIDNVVSANLKAAEAPADQVAGNVYNPATGRSISILKLVSDLNELTRQCLKPNFEPERTGDVKNSLADISAAQRDFSYEVLTSWEDGLAQTLEHYRIHGE